MVVVAMWFYFVFVCFIVVFIENNYLFLFVRLQIGFVFVLVQPYPPNGGDKKAQNQSGRNPDLFQNKSGLRIGLGQIATLLKSVGFEGLC
jgi:hypothetical protein